MPSKRYGPNYRKKWKKGDRNWNNPQYIEWRKAVRARDGNTCRKCGIKPPLASRTLICHHVRRWADQPTLRFAVNNGITLCKKCHSIVTGNEDAYAPLFLRLIAKKGSNGDTKSTSS
jgi:5-methylcytosine-specific restriction endonuclease McrA